MARFYQISNQMLQTGVEPYGPWTNVFIIGTDFPFEKSGNSYSKISDWTGANQKSNRAAAGNAVYMAGNYFDGGTPAGGAAGGEKVIEEFHKNSDLTFFVPNMGYMWDIQDSNIPRGSHTSYISGGYTESGHWKKTPSYDDGINTIATDPTYINQFGTDSSKWNATNEYGTDIWHSNWLSSVKNLQTNSTVHYDNLFAWYLMDEPYNSDIHRDYATNDRSVNGHYTFCSGVEGSSQAWRPKMVGLAFGYNDQYTNLSNSMDIVGGNMYNTGSAECWTTPNMVAWIKQKIGSTSSKMIIPWIFGYGDSEVMKYYFFYGSIVEGARGILWWMAIDSDNYDYSNYQHQRNIRAKFTNQRIFRNDYTGGIDQNFILSGDVISHTWLSNPDFTPTNTGYSRFGQVLNSRFSSLVLKYGGYYRIFVINHEHDPNSSTSTSFELQIDTNELQQSGWTKAVDRTGTLHTLGTTPGTPFRYISDSMDTNLYYQIYEIGSAVQNLT